MKLLMHPDDPTLPEHEHRIYGDDLAQCWAVIDFIDYQWAVQWRWMPVPSRGGIYLKRSRGKTPSTPSHTLYLHVEIMKRVCLAPDLFHDVVDHIDGNRLNCRRDNLRWATEKMNRANRFGSYHKQLTISKLSESI